MSDRGIFPLTRHSAVIALRSDDASERARSLDILAQAYWKPVYKHIRLKWRRSPEEAEDLTQAFFARVFERNVFERYERGRARFRAYLRVCLDRFIISEHEADQRIKRAGHTRLLSLDVQGAE